MNFDDYEDAIATMARYPGANNKLAAMIYPAFGLIGEMGEVSEKMSAIDGSISVTEHQELAKELGDVMWYLARMCVETGTTMRDVFERAVTRSAEEPELPPHAASMVLSGRIGRVSERIKKAIRDDDVSFDESLPQSRLEALREDLVTVASAYIELVSSLRLTLDAVADMNLAKLTSRHERGVWKGDGDNR